MVGAFRLDGRFTPESGAVILAALEPFKQRACLRTPNKESADAYLADALVAMAERSRSVPADAIRPGPGAVVHVRVDYSALLRGHVEPGEICEVPGVGPIPVPAALAFASDAFLAAIAVYGKDIKAVSHLGRTIPERLKTALIERDRVGVVPGCAECEDLEIDHVIPVHRHGRTLLTNLARLCRWHHYLKTFHNYVLNRVGGQWIWVGPNGPPCRSAGSAAGTGCRTVSAKELSRISQRRKIECPVSDLHLPLELVPEKIDGPAKPFFEIHRRGPAQ